ncbi:MAG: oxidoreductase [Paenibacillus sp.]|jgi:predicted dehydrogenase|nr:oxidoreductase [Paenibacillus sp.]
MNDKPIQVLVLGMMEFWIEHWRARPEVTVVGLVDVYGQVEEVGVPGKQVADFRKLNIPFYTDVAEALELLEPDIVTLVTPPTGKTDVKLIELIVNKGHDVYLEKFRPADPNDGKRLLELSKQTGRQIAIGEPYRYDKHVEEVKRLIDNGVLGTVEQVVWRCHRPTIAAAWMSAYNHVMLEDLSYHHFGVLHYMLGLERVRQVTASSRLPTWTPIASPSVVSLLAEWDDGLHLNYYSSWVAHGKLTSWLGNFRIEGSLGMVELSEQGLMFTSADGQEKQLEPAEVAYELRLGVVDEYVLAFEEKRKSRHDITVFFPVIRLIYASLESSEQGTTVTLQ